jgi:hypothetical protein
MTSAQRSVPGSRVPSTGACAAWGIASEGRGTCQRDQNRDPLRDPQPVLVGQRAIAGGSWSSETTAGLRRTTAEACTAARRPCLPGARVIHNAGVVHQNPARSTKRARPCCHALTWRAGPGCDSAASLPLLPRTGLRASLSVAVEPAYAGHQLVPIDTGRNSADRAHTAGVGHSHTRVPSDHAGHPGEVLDATDRQRMLGVHSMARQPMTSTRPGTWPRSGRGLALTCRWSYAAPWKEHQCTGKVARKWRRLGVVVPSVFCAQ